MCSLIDGTQRRRILSLTLLLTLFIRCYSFSRRHQYATGDENDLASSMLACLSTINHHRPWYADMPPLLSGGSTVTPPPSSSGMPLMLQQRVSATSSYSRISRSGGSRHENYELGRSKTSSWRVKEIESLGYYHVCYGRAMRAKTAPPTKGEIMVFDCLFVGRLHLSWHEFLLGVLESSDSPVDPRCYGSFVQVCLDNDHV